MWILKRILSTILLLTGSCVAQLRLTGDASAAFVKSENGPSQYTFDDGRGTFAWQFDLFGDAVIADDVFFLSNFRMVQDQVFHIDLLAIKLANVASSGLGLEIGEIDIPFGNLGDRRFPNTNPFFNLPLTHEHLTTLKSSDYEFWPNDTRYILTGDGMRLLDQGLYDLGAKIYGGLGIFDIWVAVIDGMVGATTVYSSNYSSLGLNRTGGFGKIVRLTATPFTGFTVGSSYAVGPFLRQGSSAMSTEYNLADNIQKTIEGDIDFSFDHLAFYGEGFYNIWRLGNYLSTDLRAIGYSIEGKYSPLPRVSIAIRAGGIMFNDIVFVPPQGGYLSQFYNGPWDRDVFRLEGALGYRLDRAALVKVVYEWNRTYNIPVDPHDNLFVIQMVVSF